MKPAVFAQAGAITLVAVALVVIIGCGLLSEKVPIDDPRVQRLLESAASFDRESYGFSPIPEHAECWLQGPYRDQYAEILEMSAQTFRQIYFVKDQDRFIWAGEQETFTGPKEFETEDGIVREHITLKFVTKENTGSPPPNQLWVSYWGEDSRITRIQDLTLRDVQPLLEEWGYR